MPLLMALHIFHHSTLTAYSIVYCLQVCYSNKLGLKVSWDKINEIHQLSVICFPNGMMRFDWTWWF